MPSLLNSPGNAPIGRYFCSVLCQLEIAKVQPPLRVRVITWNIAEISKSVKAWLNEELNGPEWRAIIEKLQYDILCVTVQEDTLDGNKQFF